MTASYVDVLHALPRLTWIEIWTVCQVIDELHPKLRDNPPPLVEHKTPDEAKREFEARCDQRLADALAAIRARGSHD